MILYSYLILSSNQAEDFGLAEVFFYGFIADEKESKDWF